MKSKTWKSTRISPPYKESSRVYHVINKSNKQRLDHEVQGYGRIGLQTGRDELGDC